MRQKKLDKPARPHLINQTGSWVIAAKRPSERARPRRRAPSALFHHESFMRGKITRRGAKGLDGRQRERKKKNLSPLRQKASVVSKSTLICDLADPRLEEACGKEKKMSQVIFFTFAIWGPELFFMQTLWFRLKVWISPLPPPTPLPPHMTFWPNGNENSDGNESERKQRPRGICPHHSSNPHRSFCPAFVL